MEKKNSSRNMIKTLHEIFALSCIAMHKKKITLKSNEENDFELINNIDSFTISQLLSGLVTTTILLCYCLYLCTKLHTAIQNSTHPVVFGWGSFDLVASHNNIPFNSNENTK